MGVGLASPICLQVFTIHELKPRGSHEVGAAEADPDDDDGDEEDVAVADDEETFVDGFSGASLTGGSIPSSIGESRRRGDRVLSGFLLFFLFVVEYG